MLSGEVKESLDYGGIQVGTVWRKTLAETQRLFSIDACPRWYLLVQMISTSLRGA
jgi:hypothetical protein